MLVFYDWDAKKMYAEKKVILEKFLKHAVKKQVLILSDCVKSIIRFNASCLESAYFPPSV